MSEIKTDGAPTVLRARPLSPHLQIWRWHITMAASILHRVSGVANVTGGLVLAGWVTALASGPAAYGAYMGALGSLPGRLVLFGYTLSVFYHLGNGVRHLGWDSGVGFEPRRADFTAVVVFAFAVVASLAVWLIALMSGAH